MLNEKERLAKALKNEKVDRPPCICPGGMMNMVTAELMDVAGITWPEAHLNPEMMANLAIASYENKCFENVGVPFCMTIEAEAMGSQVTMGSKIFEPHVTGYAFDSVKDWKKLHKLDLTKGRAKVVLDAIKIIKSKNLNAPIIGNITGPVSVASSVIEPSNFYKSMRKDNETVHEYMKFITEEIIEFANAQIEAGADTIVISDPSGTGEILGPKFFEEFVVKYINMLLDGIKDKSVGTIVHICGQMKNVYNEVAKVKSDALSFDSIVSIKKAKEHLGNRVIMGNVSTYVLEFASESQVEAMAKTCIKSGSDIISPACGLGTKSPIANIQSILKAVKQEIE
jgi:methyltransferase, mtaA/cmuA family